MIFLFKPSLLRSRMVPPAAVVAAPIFRVRFYSSLLQRRMVSPAAVVAATLSVSDSNLRCCEGEWPACSGRCGSNLPRLILFFVAAKENGSACYGRSGNDVRVRF